MTAYMQTSIIETVCTRESRIIFMDYSFLQKCQCLRSLESRARRIRSHDCAVQERFPLVSLQHPVILSTLASNHQVRIESRRRNHTEYLSVAGSMATIAPILCCNKRSPNLCNSISIPKVRFLPGTEGRSSFPSI